MEISFGASDDFMATVGARILATDELYIDLI